MHCWMTDDMYDRLGHGSRSQAEVQIGADMSAVQLAEHVARPKTPYISNLQNEFLYSDFMMSYMQYLCERKGCSV